MSTLTLGILGGGQLGQMLLEVANRWSIETRVLDPSDQCSCRHLTPYFQQGDFSDYETVIQFGKLCDIITIEIEHVNVKALYSLRDNHHIKVYPEPEVLETIQNKTLQKKFFVSKGIPTSPFVSFIKRPSSITKPCFWKQATMGYDGYGVKRLESASDLRNIPDTDCILEDPVQIKRELSVIVCRKKNNSTTTNDSLPDVVSYPPVEMIFNSDSNQVEYVYTIDDHKSDTVLAKATSIALDVSEQLGHTGLLAVELFQTIDDNILVNELAPRPHNSGHLTLSQPVSQFEQHLRAIMDYPLAPPLFTNSSVMINLVGSQGHDGPVKYQGFDCALEIPGVEIYLYGKKTTRPNRKMGHVVMTRHRGETTRMLLERAKKLKNTLTVVSIHES